MQQDIRTFDYSLKAEKINRYAQGSGFYAVLYLASAVLSISSRRGPRRRVKASASNAATLSGVGESPGVARTVAALGARCSNASSKIGEVVHQQRKTS